MSERDHEQHDTNADDDVLTGEDVVLEEASLVEPEYTTDFGDTSEEALVGTAEHDAVSFATPDDAQETDGPKDVLGNRVDSTLAEDGESLVAVAAVEETTADTSVMRRSLIETPTQYLPEPQEEPMPNNENDTLLAGATVLPTVPSRAGARWLSLLGTLLITPLAWYVLSDSGARLMMAENNPWLTGAINPAAIAELIGGIALLILLAILAAQSGLGFLVTGILVTIFGFPFVFIPGYTSDLLGTYITQPLQNWNTFGENIAYHLEFTGSSGILFMTGIAMLSAAWVVYYVRRKGRAEEALREEVAASNPDGLRARWARKASEEA